MKGDAIRPVFAALLLLLGGCTSREREEEGGNRGAASAPGSGAAPATTGLTGLYEQGRSQLCIIAAKGKSRFGLVVRETGMASCSGSGAVRREPGQLVFRMAGDSPCTLRARISGRTIVFPRKVPNGCAYYCGAGASLAGARLVQSGRTEKAARAARDLVGEPLCTDE